MAPLQRRVDGWVTALIVALGLVLYGWVAVRAVFHCDEFNLLRHVTDFALGDYSEPGRPGLLFFPLMPLLRAGGPAEAMFAARAVAVALVGVSALLTARLAARLGPAGSAPAAALVLLGSANTLAHGIELRTDSFTTPLALVALIAWFDRPARVRTGLWLGVLHGLAFTVSQKAIYGVVALGLGFVMAWLVLPAARRRAEAGPTLVALVTQGAVAGTVVAAWYTFMGILSGQGWGFVQSNLGAAADTAFSADGSISSRLGVLALSARLGPLTWYGAAFAMAALPWLSRRGREPTNPAPGDALGPLPPASRLAAATVVGLALAATLLVHRGYFLYFTASFEPFLAALSGAGVAASWSSGRWWLRGAVAVGCVALVAALAPKVVRYRAVHNGYQLAIVDTVTALYPRPVAYADGIGMLPGYRMVGFFNTRLNRTWKRQGGGGSRVAAWRSAPALVYILEYCSRMRYLTDDERVFFDSHYLPYANNVYLHGGRVQVEALEQRAEARLDLLVDGPYTVVHRACPGRSLLDGTPVSDGAVVDLRKGVHVLEHTAACADGEAWVLHGADRHPQARPVDWSGFASLKRSRYQDYKDQDLKTPPENKWLRSGGKAGDDEK